MSLLFIQSQTLCVSPHIHHHDTESEEIKYSRSVNVLFYKAFA